VIDLGADAPDRYAVAARQPETGFAMIEERVPLPVEQPMHVLTQRRDPARIIAMEAVGQIDKAVAIAPAAKRGHFDSTTGDQFPFARGTRVGSIRRGEGQGMRRLFHRHRNEEAAGSERCRMLDRDRTQRLRRWTVSENRDYKKHRVLHPPWRADKETRCGRTAQ